MDKIAIDLGFITIYWYSIMVMLGAIIAFYLIKKESIKKEINQDFITNLIFYTFIFGIIGARIYYVIFNFDYFSNNVSEIFQIWNGGLAIHGGIIVGFITCAIYCKKYKVNILKIIDLVAPALIIAQSIGRWGNFFNKEAYGQATTLLHLKKLHLPQFIIDGMYINGNYYQPTFLYESIWNLLGFILLISIRKFYKKLKIGQLAGIYLMWYSTGRFMIERFRSDSLMLGDFKIAQIISIIMFIIGFVLVFILSKKQHLYKETTTPIKY